MPMMALPVKANHRRTRVDFVGQKQAQRDVCSTGNTGEESSNQNAVDVKSRLW